MKIGRNDPCVCGSGLKYKRCCGKDASSYVSPPPPDPFDFCKRIAYIGNIGQQRREFCERMLTLCQEYNRAAMVELFEVARIRGKDITCQPGCANCCSQHIGATLQEAEAIVYYLYTQGEEALTFFIGNYKIWRGRVGKEPLFDKLNQTAASTFEGFYEEKRQEFLRISGSYGRLNIPCPFLKNNYCIIYPVRPKACASVVSISPPSHCVVTNELKPELLVVLQTKAPTIPYFWGSEESLIYSNAPLLVYEILHGGYIYLSQMPGLSGLDKAAFADPAVQNCMR